MTTRRAAVFVVAIGVALVAAQVPVPARPAITREELAKALDAQRKLDLAKIYVAANRFAEARKLLEEALTLDPVNLDAKGLLTRLLDSENQRLAERQRADLDEAEWQLATGNRDKALELARNVSEVAQDTQILGRAATILQRCRPDLAGEVWQLGRRVWSGWGFDLVAILLLLVTFWLIALLARGAYTLLAGRRVWRVRGIEDKAGLGAAGFAQAAFSRLRSHQPVSQPASAGLLRLDPPPPQATGLQVKLGEPESLAKSLEGIQLKVGALEMGAAARLLAAVGRWFQAGLPVVTGAASCADSVVTVRLTARAPDQRTITVSASEQNQPGSDAARTCAERAVLKVGAWMANPRASEAELDAVGALREGAELLERYLTGESAGVLEQALSTFRRARLAQPKCWEVWLYEGITLDLLERHEEAVLRFEYVRSHAEAPVLDKAVYNQAVSYLRKCRPQGVKRAFELFTELVGLNPDVRVRPIQGLAKVGRVNALAQYPIFWQDLLHGRPALDGQECIQWKRADFPTVLAWRRQVLDLAKQIEEDLKAIRAVEDTPWDDWALRQLEWGRLTALGNVHLNLATGFLEDPSPDEFDTVKKDRQEYLRAALEHFRASEMILTPGVETLAHLGTTLVFLGQSCEGRDYLARAMALNPAYEYAYYRMAQSWDLDEQPEKVKQVLVSYGRRVVIRHFLDLYSKHGVAPPD